jgi:hypothetical protein
MFRQRVARGIDDRQRVDGYALRLRATGRGDWLRERNGESVGIVDDVSRRFMTFCS